MVTEEMTDNTENITEEYTDRLHTLGADYLICNLFVIFSGGAAVAALFKLKMEKTGFIPLFLCMSLMVAIFWFLFNINAGDHHSVFYRAISKTIDKNRGKYGFEEAYIFRGYSGTVLIDTLNGRIVYISNMNPWKFQMISAASIGKILVNHVPYMTKNFTTYVFFQFYHKNKKIHIPTYATNGNGRSLTDKEVAHGFSDAEAGAERLREAKQAALMREAKKGIDHSSIVPDEMWTIETAGKKQVIYDIDNFTDTVRKALQDVEAGREERMMLTTQEPVFDIKTVCVSRPMDPGYMHVEYVHSENVQSHFEEYPAVMDVLSVCTELFLKRDPGKDGK